jgi:hypothetical protein
MNAKTKLFIILWLAGMAGVLSFLLVDLDALLKSLPLPEGTEIPVFTPALKLLSLIQPAVIMSLAVLIGVALAGKVRLHAPAAEAAASGEKFWLTLKPQIIPGILGGLGGGLAIVLMGSMSKWFLPPETLTRITELGKLLPIPTRLLYGGVTEELLLRWGVMTLLVWAAWRLLNKGQDKPKTVYFAGAILVSSVIFGIGHLPIALMFVSAPTFAFVSYVIVANSIFGIIAGWLFWKKGLESAIIAHMLCHITMLTASYFGAYF